MPASRWAVKRSANSILRFTHLTSSPALNPARRSDVAPRPSGPGRWPSAIPSTAPRSDGSAPQRHSRTVWSALAVTRVFPSGATCALVPPAHAPAAQIVPSLSPRPTAAPSDRRSPSPRSFRRVQTVRTRPLPHAPATRTVPSHSPHPIAAPSRPIRSCHHSPSLRFSRQRGIGRLRIGPHIRARRVIPSHSPHLTAARCHPNSPSPPSSHQGGNCALKTSSSYPCSTCNPFESRISQ